MPATAQQITPLMADALRLMTEAEDADLYEDAEIVCDRSACYIGFRPIARGTVNRLLQLMAISDGGVGGEVYVINDTGRALLRRPELAAEIQHALATGGAFTIENDRLVQI